MKFEDAFFYHLYPLGALGVMRGERGPHAAPSPLARVAGWIPALERVGANALLLGPVFESEWHGYDTVDYRKVDGRLGTERDLAELSASLRARGIGLVLDAVFNHVGRSHPIVREAVEQGAAAPRAHWIAGYDPSRRGRGGLPFAYQGWSGNYELVRLDTSLPAVQDYLIDIALHWIDAYDIAGLRLDAADCLDHGFLRRLGDRCRARDPEFFLFGEAVQGDLYRPLIDEGGLDGVTDFEACKGLWSSYNDKNFHEIAWTLDRLFGAEGLCRGRLLYSFVDNHDVDRVASLVRDPAGLSVLYGLLFAMPGVPSIYYGSEVGMGGRRSPHDDYALRPALDPSTLECAAPQPWLAPVIARLAAARRASPAVRTGSYQRLAVEPLGIAFLRQAGADLALLAVNASEAPMTFDLLVPELAGRSLVDLLDPEFRGRGGRAGGALRVDVPPHWLRWLVLAP